MSKALGDDGKGFGETWGFMPASCDTCARKFPQSLGCQAFARIPDEILAGDVAHTEPYPGDHGLTYLPVVNPARAGDAGKP